MARETMSIREQIMWYVEKLAGKLTEREAQMILAMLNRIYLSKKE